MYQKQSQDYNIVYFPDYNTLYFYNHVVLSKNRDGNPQVFQLVRDFFLATHRRIVTTISSDAT